MSGRNYVGTINNPTEADRECLSSSTDEGGPCVFAIYQFERGSNGTAHIQLYVRFRRKLRVGQACRLLGGRATVFLRRGTHDEARTYCTKEETREPGPLGGPYLVGEIPPPGGAGGHRSDLDAVRDSIVAGATEASIADEHFGAYVRYHRGICRVMELRASRRSTFDMCWIYWGVTGTGKTHRAFHDFPGAYWTPGGSKMWFDGYAGESAIVIDEYSPSIMPYSQLLRLCDKYPFNLPVKGGFIQCRATIVVLTANVHPREWYPTESLAPLLRRATIVQFTDAYRPS